MSASMPTQASPESHDRSQSPLADPALRRALEDFVRRRVPASDVDDIVQTVLCDALASRARPTDDEELRKWLLGIARHKVADHHRRAVREPASELPEIEAGPEAGGDVPEARSLARWAEDQASTTSEAQKTLAWMAREGDGEKLENIAAEENVPAARVRQRVSRMRRWMKERWLAELAAVAVIAAVIVIAWRLLRRGDKEVPEARPDEPQLAPSFEPAPEPTPKIERARQVRADALRKCDASEFRACLEGLDEAARLDPDGDRAPGIAAARERAASALREESMKALPDVTAPSNIPQAPPSTRPAPTEVSSTPKPPSPRPTVVPTSIPTVTPPTTGKVGPSAKPTSATPSSLEKPAPKPTGGAGSNKKSGGITKGSLGSSGFDLDSDAKK